MDALSYMLDSGAARITGTCLDEGEYYYVIEDLVHQTTRHALVDKLDVTYLEADTTNGVTEESEPSTYADIVPQGVFFASLRDLEDADLIGAYVTRSMYDQIESTYGLSRPPRLSPRA